MQLHKLTSDFAISAQVTVDDVKELAARGVRTLICNRPDGEAADQPSQDTIGRAATAEGLTFHYLPTSTSDIADSTVDAFATLLQQSPTPVVAYCRSGTRAAMLWALSEAGKQSLCDILKTTKKAEVDISSLAHRIGIRGRLPQRGTDSHYQVVIVGAGSAGIATASSLKSRQPGLEIVLIDPADAHYYQPGWTMVGGGVFEAKSTVRTMASVIPSDVQWIKESVVAFDPESNTLILENGRVVQYEQLIVCPGLKLDWAAIDGLPEALGTNGVTSNYRYDLAPYTWQLVQQLDAGKALFTQPPMPIKCAGAPQKALYLSCDYWLKNKRQGKVKTHFYNAGAVLFGVADYVPALMAYMEKYAVDLMFSHTLIAVDGPNKRATFLRTHKDGSTETVVEAFDMLHVAPPQVAPDFIRTSPLVDAAGWVDVDPTTLRHRSFLNIHALGDVINTTNAKTMAAARKQAPVVATNVLVGLGLKTTRVAYNGYGSCPLTVERGKVVLAEFLYGGKLAPTFSRWILDGRKPSRLGWLLKEHILPPFYWHCMLKGREWFADTPMIEPETQP
jgi:sulfide:quinone oxidoreductase